MDIKNKQIIAKITSKNQITIPKEVRTDLDLESNDSIEFIKNKEGGFSVKKIKSSNLWDIVAQQEKMYGSIATPEIEWGTDIEAEDLN